MQETHLKNELTRLGMTGAGFVAVPQLPFSPEVRGYCEQNKCGQYGKTWACPPAFGSVDACKARCAAYDQMLVFAKCYPLADSFDFEGMLAAKEDFAALARQFGAYCARQSIAGLLLGNEGCSRCAKCTYPDSPCRFPDELIYSLEGFGLRVDLLAQAAGIAYHGGPNTVTYFGGFLLNAKETTV